MSRCSRTASLGSYPSSPSCSHASQPSRLIPCLYSAAPSSIDQIVSDFDGVTFHISTPESKTKILVSLQIKCFNELVQYGAQSVLEREYGPYIVAPESGYDFSVLVDLENLPEDKGRNHKHSQLGQCSC